MQTMQPDETRSLRLKDVANQPVIAPQQRSYLHIRHGERELAELFENATVGLRDVGPNGIIVAVNRAELNLLGYSPDEYIGHHIAEFHADKEVACDILRRLRAGEELHGYEARMVCKDGAIKHVVIHSNVSRADGRFAYMRCLTLDITKQKRAQQRLAAYDAVTRALASSSALDTAAMEILRAVCDYLDWQVGVLWHVDGDARVLRCAALWHLPGLEIPRFTAATRQQTFERGTGLPGQVWGTGRAVWIPHASSEINFLRAGIADSEGLHAAFAFPIVIKDEVLGVIEFWSQETREPDEDLLQMMTGIGSQIGQFIERKQAEERLRRKEEQLQQLNAELEKRVAERTAELVSSIGERENLQRQLLQAQKMESLGTLAGGIAHDFNNLLNIILGYTLLLEHKGYRGDPSEALDIIKQTVNRAAVLVQQLLAIARKTEIKFQEIDINGRILSLKQLLKATFPKTVEVVLELDPSVPAVLADPGQIDQVLLNLCVNARDAMPNGGSLVLATSVVAGDELRRPLEVSADQRYLCIRATDDGIGMDEATRSRIFEPFFTTKPQGEGTGLGLSVLYGIVASHSGFIDVESSPNEGTTFRIYLPVERKAGTAVESCEQRPEAVHGRRDGEFGTVLFVEDEENQLRLMGELLKNAGYRVLTAHDGEEAVELHARHKDEIALIVLDFGLPKLNGWEAFQRIRRLDENVSVFLATGFVSPEIEAAMRSGRLAGIINKPYRLDELLERISNLSRQVGPG